MSPFAICGAALVGIGLYGFLTRIDLLHRLIAFNVIGSGIFLLLGALSAGDPVPQALIITGIVVALSLTALAVGLIVRFAGERSRDALDGEADVDGA